jgi:Flp pilus assembly pilin Flp
MLPVEHKGMYHAGQDVIARFLECLRDERGTAMTEYLLITGIMVPVAAYLFHPDNGLYQAVRDQYNMTSALLIYPGP